MEQMQLFLSLKEADIVTANSVGRNYCLRNINDLEALQLYIEFCIEQINAEKSEFFSFFVNEANVMCQYFLDNAIVSSDSLSLFLDLKNKLENRIRDCTEYLNKQSYKECKSLIDDISQCIGKYALPNVSKKNKSKYLEEIARLDERIVADALPEDLRNEYNSLTVKVAEITENNRKAAQKKQNLNALKDIKEAFDTFSKDSEYKKNEDKLSSLLKNKMYCHNLDELNTEILTYYNYVYNYIFSKVKDELKFKMVLWSIK
ncbi:MAG: hypothetical protein HUK02_04225 [Bacteroidaceae bacterium]|nr:hypothetical protein [Bacteroidaceae bacterium]